MHGFSQTALAELCDVSRHAQMRYEKGESEPTQSYYEKLDQIGFDILYLVTGKHSKETLSMDESELLELFNNSTLQLRAAAMAVLKSGQTTTSDRTIDNVGQYIEGDVNDQTIHGGFNFGNKKE